MMLAFALIMLVFGLGLLCCGLLLGNELVIKAGHYFDGVSVGAGLCWILGSTESNK